MTDHVEWPECLDEPDAYKDPDVLEFLYIEKGLGVRVIAQTYETTKGKVQYQLQKHHIRRNNDHPPKSGPARKLWDMDKDAIGGASP